MTENNMKTESLSQDQISKRNSGFRSRAEESRGAAYSSESPQAEDREGAGRKPELQPKGDLGIDAKWEDIRKKLDGLSGQEYWRSLGELSGTEEFKEFLHHEFPEQARALPDEFSRREFLKLMGASLMLAGLGGCSKQPTEKIVPYAKSPEEIVPGKPLYFATAMPLGLDARPLLVESHMGRPTKIEGNPEHPSTLGGADIWSQASLLSLYDPDRSQIVKHNGRISSWDSFSKEFTPFLEILKQKKGEGLRILTGTVTSPTIHQQMRAVMTLFPSAKWHRYEAVGDENIRAGSIMAFGEYVHAVYSAAEADVILSLESDFLYSEPGSLRYAREFAKKRKAGSEPSQMNRLYVAESFPTVTGASADHRLSIPAGLIEELSWLLLKNFGVDAPAVSEKAKAYENWAAAVAKDLKSKSGKSLVVAGAAQPPAVHAAAHVLNQALGNIGKTVTYTASPDPHPASHRDSFKELTSDMAQGKVGVLIMIGVNPVYDAPWDLEFEKNLDRIGMRIHMGVYEDETSNLSHWHIPQAHYLETWGDAAAYDGTLSILQPLIEPLYNGKSPVEFLSILAGKPGLTSYEIVRESWKARSQALDFESFWRKTVHDGFAKNSSLPAKKVTLKAFTPRTRPQAAAGGLEINFRPDPSVLDGRFANNAWLQELPKPITKLTWDNAVFIAPRTAESLGLVSEDVVALKFQNKLIEAPVWILPGHAEGSVTVHLGYGRSKGGKIAKGTGFNAYKLRNSESLWTGTGLQIQKTGRKYKLVSTQEHSSMEGRELVREAAVNEFEKHPHFAHEGHHEPAKDMTLYKDSPELSKEYAWGMAIDLSACTGCNACVIACQSENNIPVVGKQEVSRGREMHWIRVDRYFKGNPDNPEFAQQPVPCMHCENAPCEPVCPVGATTHSPEGLNEMTYNRCVGTKYCSNNCPYKVRRFNFFEYVDSNTEILKMIRNPDVTTRVRGVMEKCTYCVQRINKARIEAKKQDRLIRDGEIVTACQSSCPSEAIIFGNTLDPASKVSKLKANPLNYSILADLGTRPRTTYLAKLRNPNPEIEALHV